MNTESNPTLTILNHTKPIQDLTDAEIVEAVEDAASGAAVLNSRGRGINLYDDACRALYNECARREKVDLYSRGHRNAMKAHGF